MSVNPGLDRSRLQAEHPETRIIFADDLTALPSKVREQVDRFIERADRCLAVGRCFECGRQIPGTWPPPVTDEPVDLPAGWALYLSLGDESGPIMLICPGCDSHDNGIRLVSFRE